MLVSVESTSGRSDYNVAMQSSFKIRFRPRFSLRTAFLATTAAALWCGYQLHWLHARQEMIQNREVIPVQGSLNAPATSPPWPLRIFGESGHTTLYVANREADDRNALVRQAKSLFPEATFPDYFPMGTYNQTRASWPASQTASRRAATP
jgi:hypothetical protein